MTDTIMDETIAAIWRAHGLGDVERIERATSGVSNRCFIVDDALVIRFNIADAGTPKFENERFAYALLARRGAPVPAVIAHDTSRRIVPYEYIILTRLPGTNLAESWQTLEAEQSRHLAWEAGVALARLHAITFISRRCSRPQRRQASVCRPSRIARSMSVEFPDAVPRVR